MIGDIWTVMWKEWKEILLRGGSRRGGALLMFGIFALLLGVFFPLQAGRRWVQSPYLAQLVILPSFIVESVIADTFAGERERHTLETLLATPFRIGPSCLASCWRRWPTAGACSRSGWCSVW